MSPPKRVLIVEDEPELAEVMRDYLAQAGMEAEILSEGTLAVETILDTAPDLVVLDVMLPGASGMDLLRDGRVGGVPVILLTARVEEADRILGLEFGADDYVTKPFSPRELVARVRTVLRRAKGPVADTETLVFDGLRVDVRAREVMVGDQPVGLTAKEFDLLAFLAAAPRQVFSRAQLLEQVWESSAEFQDPATVTVHVRRLRQKLETNPDEPRWITTVFGVGYRFEP